MTPRPSDLALFVADLVADTAFPEEAARDLHRLLSATLSQPDLASHRWDLLQSLATVIREAKGQLPTAREYDAHRADRFPDAPAASSLTERYGTWLKALDAASRLMNMSLATPVWTKEQAYHQTYTPNECVAAIAQFRQRFGDWPSPGEYRDWSRATRRAAHKTGARDPELPEINVIYKRFGTFARAVETARSVYGDT